MRITEKESKNGHPALIAISWINENNVKVGYFDEGATLKIVHRQIRDNFYEVFKKLNKITEGNKS